MAGESRLRKIAINKRPQPKHRQSQRKLAKTGQKRKMDSATNDWARNVNSSIPIKNKYDIDKPEIS
jgi:hypothetical protein